MYERGWELCIRVLREYKRAGQQVLSSQTAFVIGVSKTTRVNLNFHDLHWLICVLIC